MNEHVRYSRFRLRFIRMGLPSAFLFSILFFVAFVCLPQGPTVAQAFAALTMDAVPNQSGDFVSGTVAGAADFETIRAVVFVRTDKWYPQPNPENFYLEVSPDGGFGTRVYPWKQIAAFAIREGFDAWNQFGEYDPFPLEIDGTDVLAVGVYPFVDFAGRRWAARGGDGLQPGGPFVPGGEVSSGCDYRAGEESVWVDQEGRLHLKMALLENEWRCAEVYLPTSQGFGIYHFLLESSVDQLDPNIVASPFLYYDPDNELDIEFSRWGNPAADNAQFVVQPFYAQGNRQRFQLDLEDEKSTHVVDWNPDGVVFTSAKGHHGIVPAESIVETWSPSSDDVPKEENLRVHLNLWMYGSTGPSDDIAPEMIVKDFAFYERACVCPDAGDWTVVESCTITADAFPPGGVSVPLGVDVNFAFGARLQMDWVNHGIEIAGTLTIDGGGGME